MNRLKAIIVEDEKKSREMLRNLLKSFCPEIDCVGMAESVKKAVDLIAETNPDIVFLDIEMQSGTGFDLLESLGNFHFEVIFTTAYDYYAIKAIKFNALDYLLKPIDVTELKDAVAKAIARINTKREYNEPHSPFAESSAKKSGRIIISTIDSILFIEISKVRRCEARGAYTIIYLNDGTSITASKNLKEYELLLTEFNFLRVHYSHLINLAEVQKYLKAEGVVQMKDGSKVAVSLNKKDLFLERMR